MRLVFLTVLALALLEPVSALGQGMSGNPLDNLPALKDFEARRASSSDPDWRNGNGDARPIEPGNTLTMAELEGPGRIAHIWFTISARDRWYGRLLRLRMYWDGETSPSVDCPIGDFFAQGHGMQVWVNSLPVRVSSDGRALNCYWPMPFARSARITVTNEGTGRVNALYYYVDWQKLKQLPAGTAYFHAMYRQEFPARAGSNYLILDAAGRGHYVGTFQAVRLNEGGWYGEGDDFFFIDGEAEPSLRGTGTEDYFCDAWGFRKFDGLYYGLPVFEGFNPGDRVSVYRWHIPDPIPFTRSLRVEIEHKGQRIGGGGFEERFDDFATVAYWYQTEPHKPFEPMPSAGQRLLFDPRDLVELEAVVEDVRAAPKEALGTQEGPYSGGRQLFFTPQGMDASFAIPLSVADAGKYFVVLFATTSFDYGRYQITLNDQPLGKPTDFYSPAVTPREITLGPVSLERGRHELKFDLQGKNDASKGYFLGIDSLLLRKVK